MNKYSVSLILVLLLLSCSKNNPSEPSSPAANTPVSANSATLTVTELSTLTATPTLTSTPTITLTSTATPTLTVTQTITATVTVTNTPMTAHFEMRRDVPGGTTMLIWWNVNGGPTINNGAYGLTAMVGADFPYYSGDVIYMTGTAVNNGVDTMYLDLYLESGLQTWTDTGTNTGVIEKYVVP